MTPPGCNPATSVAVGEHTPYMLGAEPMCVGFQALSLCRAGGYKCVQGPQAQGWGCDSSRHLLPLCTAVQVPATSWGGRMPCSPHRVGGNSCPIPLGTGQRHLSRLNAPGEGISSRDHFAMMLSLTLGKAGQHHSQAHPHLPEPQRAATFKASQAYSLLHGGLHRHQLLLPAANHPQPPCLGGQESRLCVGQSCGHHAQVQMCQSHGTEAHATLAELPPVMVWWEKLGSPDYPAHFPTTSQASRDTSVLEQGAQKL